MDKFRIPALTLFILAFVFTPGYNSLVKEPTVIVTNVAPTEISLSGISYESQCVSKTQTRQASRSKTLKFDIYYQDNNDWVYLSHGERSGVEIKPGSNVVTIPFTVKSADLVSTPGVVMSTGEITIQLRGVAAPDILGFGPEIPFTYTTTQPLQVPQPP